jgi:hypothetical protein
VPDCTINGMSLSSSTLKWIRVAFSPRIPIREMSDPWLAQALLVGAGGGRDIALMLLKDHAGVVREFLGRPEQRVGCGAEPVDGDVAAHQRIRVPVAMQLAPKLVEAALEVGRARS